jgi:predicted ArsR family transcriptional regulator
MPAEVGRSHGRTLASGRHGDALEATKALLSDWGFDPEVVAAEDDASWIWFGHCPFSELAEANPELVCSLHRGLIEGLLEARGDDVPVDFHDRTARQPCCVVLDVPQTEQVSIGA